MRASKEGVDSLRRVGPTFCPILSSKKSPKIRHQGWGGRSTGRGDFRGNFINVGLRKGFGRKNKNTGNRIILSDWRAGDPGKGLSDIPGVRPDDHGKGLRDGTRGSQESQEFGTSLLSRLAEKNGGGVGREGEGPDNAGGGSLRKRKFTFLPYGHEIGLLVNTQKVEQDLRKSGRSEGYAVMSTALL